MDSATSEPASADGADEIREQVAQACRILAQEGLAENVLGHVSARISTDTVLVRCRGPRERGLHATTIDDIRLCTLDGQILDDPTGTYRVPYELPIHSVVYRRRPTAGSVVHAHPRSTLLSGLADLPLRPVFGAYNIPALTLAREHVPTWPRPVLIASDSLADDMVDTLGESDVCVLRGHGIVAVGDNVQQATARALSLHVLAEVTVELARIGAHPPTLTAEDLAQLPDLGTHFNDRMMWAYYADKDPQNASAGHPVQSALPP